MQQQALYNKISMFPAYLQQSIYYTIRLLLYIHLYSKTLHVISFILALQHNIVILQQQQLIKRTTTSSRHRHGLRHLFAQLHWSRHNRIIIQLYIISFYLYYLTLHNKYITATTKCNNNKKINSFYLFCTNHYPQHQLKSN